LEGEADDAGPRGDAAPAGEDPAATGMMRLPLDAFFRIQIALPRLRPLPPLDGSLGGWPQSSRLPDLTTLHGQLAFGEVRAGWAPEGLAFAVRADVGHVVHVDREHPFRSDGIEVWIDTRDSRDARKPTRFCHHFLVLPGGAGLGGRTCAVRELNPGGVKRPEDMADVRRIHAAARPTGQGYALECFLPAEVLVGYTPQEAVSIGLAYRLRSPVCGLQDLAWGEGFPLWRNPSLWLSARLLDSDAARQGHAAEARRPQ
jgi:hypothetical protein